MAQVIQPSYTPAVAAIKPILPGPLGLGAFGITTCALSAINVGLVGPDAMPAIVPLGFALGGIGQLIAGIFEYRGGNTFAGTAFCAYSMFWFWFSLLNWTAGAGWIKPPSAQGVGLVLLMWGIFTFLMWIITFRAAKATCGIFLLLWITFVLLGISEFGYKTLALIGGWIGLLTGVLAFLTGFAELLNHTANRTVIPLGAPILID